YEFEDALKDPCDANWLILRVTLQSVHGAWRRQVEHAGALTWEEEDCVNWLRALSTGESVTTDRWTLCERDVRFDVIWHDDGAVVGLTVQLRDEFQPPTKVLMPRENNIVSLRFHTPPEALEHFANRIEANLARFPQRGERPAQPQPG